MAMHEGGEPWPPFVMVFRNTAAATGDVRVVRLEYRSSRVYCDSVLAAPPLPTPSPAEVLRPPPKPPTRPYNAGSEMCMREQPA